MVDPPALDVRKADADRSTIVASTLGDRPHTDETTQLRPARRLLLQGGLAAAVTLLARHSFAALASGTSTPEPRGDRGAVKIAVVQQDGNPGQVEANRKKALGFATQALAQHADVILFHEELLVG